MRTSLPPHERKTYAAWQAAKNRCHNPKAQDYRYYGAKGVTMCEEWRSSYETFASDMGHAPTPLHTLDRVDGAQGYSKDNCRWATRQQQSRNRKYAVALEHNGVALHTWEWAKLLGISPHTFHHRLWQHNSNPNTYSYASIFSERDEMRAKTAKVPRAMSGKTKVLVLTAQSMRGSGAKLDDIAKAVGRTRAMVCRYLKLKIED